MSCRKSSYVIFWFTEEIRSNIPFLQAIYFRTMPPALTTEEKIKIVLLCGDNYRSSREAAAIFNVRYPHKNVSHTTVSRILQKFKTTGSVENAFKVPHRKTAMIEENILNVLLSVTENPQTSGNHIAQNTDISESTVRRILKANRYYPYRPKFIHVLKDRDFDSRMDFCAWCQGMIGEDGDFLKYILFTDEATFTSNGHVSSQNCRWWATENPNFLVPCKDQYSFRVNVWCGIFNSQIVGPFFFRDNLNSENYLNFLETELSDFLDDIPLQQRAKMHFQHDGASIHSTREVTAWLDNKFNRNWIGRYSTIPWPARSPDITPLDLFLWGYFKNKVYKLRPFRNREHLEECIRHCVASITPSMLRNVRKEFSSRTMLCMEREGRLVEF